MGGDAQELALRFAGQASPLLAIPGLHEGGQDKRGERDEHVEDLQRDHLLEKGLCREWAGPADGCPHGDP